MLPGNKVVIIELNLSTSTFFADKIALVENISLLAFGFILK